jgi:hypothetical protein
MKKFLFTCLVLLSVSAISQAQTIDKFFAKYQHDPSFTVINVTPKMFTMFTKMASNDADAKQLMNVVGKLKGLRILIKENTTQGKSMFQEASKYFDASLSELMSVKSKDADIRFLIKENAKGNIAELIMLLGSKEEFLCLNLFGDLDLNEISQIAQDVKIDGFENLSKLPKKK